MEPRAIVVRWKQLSEDLTSVNSVDLVRHQGKQFAARCAFCKSFKTQLNVVMGECKLCKNPWALENVTLRSPPTPLNSYLHMKVRATESHRNTREEQLVELALLGAIIHRAETLDLWGTRAFVLYHGEHRSQNWVAKKARRNWRHAPFQWSRDRVRQLIPQGKEALQHVQKLGVAPTCAFSL